MVLKYNNQQNKMLTEYLNEKVDCSSVHYKISSFETDKKLSKAKRRI